MPHKCRFETANREMFLWHTSQLRLKTAEVTRASNEDVVMRCPGVFPSRLRLWAHRRNKDPGNMIFDPPRMKCVLCEELLEGPEGVVAHYAEVHLKDLIQEK